MLTLYDGEKVTPFPTAADEYLKKNQVYTSVPLPDGGFCITTLRGGAVIIEHDGRLRRIINKDAGLHNEAVYAAYPDREGALWLGHGRGMTRVEVNSPISIFSRGTAGGVARHNGTLYVVDAAGGTALFRLVPKGKAGLSSLQAIPTPLTQAFSLLTFHDPAGKTPDQLLAATAEGIMRIEGDSVSPAVPGLARSHPGSLPCSAVAEISQPGVCGWQVLPVLDSLGRRQMDRRGQASQFH